MSARARLLALRAGPRPESDRRWLIGPNGLLAVAQGLASDRLRPVELGDCEALFEWLDDASVALDPAPSDRARALLAAASLSVVASASELRAELEVIQRGFRGDSVHYDDLSIERGAGEGWVDAVLRESVAANCAELDHVLRTVHRRTRSPRRRVVSLPFPASSHDAGEVMVFHVARVAGLPRSIIDIGAAPFFQCDAEFAAAIDAAWRAVGVGFAARWHVEFEVSRRPAEWITGPSVGLAAATALRALDRATTVGSDLTFTGIVERTGAITTLLRADGRHGYEHKMTAVGGRRLVVPADDAPLVAELAARQSRGPSVFGVGHIDELDALLEGLSSGASRTRSSGPAAPRRRPVDGRLGVFGRDAERYRIAALVEAGGAPRVVLVSGRPGIGKTRLLEAAIADNDHVEVLRASGDELGANRAAIERVVSAATTTNRGAAVLERARLLVLDDAHLIGDEQLRQVSDFVMSDTTADVVAVIAFRDTNPPETLTELLAAARRGHPSVVSLPLAPLPDVEIQAWVDEASESSQLERRTDLGQRISALSGGDPLITAQLLEVVTSAPSVDEALRALTASSGSGGMLVEIVQRRMKALPRPQVVIAAAVLGDRADEVALRAVTQLEADSLWEALNAATEARLLVESGSTNPSYRFAHDVVRDTVYGLTSVARRNQYHLRAAEYFEGIDDPTILNRNTILAHHFGAIAAGTYSDRAMRYALAAGDDSATARAFDDAEQWYERAVKFAGVAADLDGLVAAQIGLGRNLRRRGDPSAGAVLLNAARRATELRRPELLVDAVLAAHRGFFSQTARVDTKWIALLEQAIAVVGDDLSARAELLAVLAGELTWQADDDRRFELSDEALDLALASGALPTIARVRYRRSMAIACSARVADREQNSRELLVVADRLGDDETRFMAAITRATVAAEIGRMDEALIRVHDAEVSAETLRERSPMFIARLARAGSLLSQGELDAAEAVSREAMELGRRAEAADAHLLHGEQMWEISRLRGRYEEVVPLATAVAGLSDPTLCVFGARFAWDCGAQEVGRAAYERVRNGGRPVIAASLIEPAIERDLALLATRMQDRDTSAFLFERLRPNADFFANTTVVRPCGRHALALLSTVLDRPDAADHFFSTAVDLHHRVRVPLLEAETLVEWGRALLARGGDRARAVALLDRAIDLSGSLDAEGIVRTARELRGTAA